MQYRDKGTEMFFGGNSNDTQMQIFWFFALLTGSVALAIYLLKAAIEHVQAMDSKPANGFILATIAHTSILIFGKIMASHFVNDLPLFGPVTLTLYVIALVITIIVMFIGIKSDSRLVLVINIILGIVLCAFMFLLAFGQLIQYGPLREAEARHTVETNFGQKKPQQACTPQRVTKIVDQFEVVYDGTTVRPEASDQLDELILEQKAYKADGCEHFNPLAGIAATVNPANHTINIGRTAIDSGIGRGNAPPYLVVATTVEDSNGSETDPTDIVVLSGQSAPPGTYKISDQQWSKGYVVIRSRLQSALGFTSAVSELKVDLPR